MDSTEGIPAGHAHITHVPLLQPQPSPEDEEHILWHCIAWHTVHVTHIQHVEDEASHIQ